MEPFELAQSFMESSLRPGSTRTLATAFQQAVEHLGFRNYACCSHVDPLVPLGAVMLQNYPDDWIHAFSGRKLHVVDPVLLRAERSLLPFFWDAPDFLSGITTPQQEILSEVASHGLDRGYTIPIHAPWTGALRASCSVVPDSGSIDKRSYFAVQLMAIHLYNSASGEHAPPPAASPQSVLSPRERQCLELAGQGQGDWEIGQLLHLSEHTVHRHIETAKRRLGVTTRMQAVIRALHGRQISFGDVLRADTDPSVSRDAECAPPDSIDTR
jgi:DNA-binding CsgD family transcriptional regulator